jgi:hypothetical protein
MNLKKKKKNLIDSSVETNKTKANKNKGYSFGKSKTHNEVNKLSTSLYTAP